MCADGSKLPSQILVSASFVDLQGVKSKISQLGKKNSLYNFEILMYEVMKHYGWSTKEIIESIPKMYAQLNDDQKAVFVKPELKKDLLFRGLANINIETICRQKISLLLQDMKQNSAFD